MIFKPSTKTAPCWRKWLGKIYYYKTNTRVKFLTMQEVSKYDTFDIDTIPANKMSKIRLP